MKPLIYLIFCTISLAVFAAEGDETLVQVLTPEQVKEVTTSAYNHKVTRYQHNQSRLSLARESNRNMASAGAPLQRPYYGDLAGNSAGGHNH